MTASQNDDFKTYEDFLACFEMDEDPRDIDPSTVATYENPDGTTVDIEIG